MNRLQERIANSRYNPMHFRLGGFALGGALGFGLGYGSAELVNVFVEAPYDIPPVSVGAVGGMILATVYGVIAGRNRSEV